MGADSDRLDTINVCLAAVADLIDPTPTWHANERDKTAVLLTFLLNEQQQLLKKNTATTA